MTKGLHVTYPTFLSDFIGTKNFKIYNRKYNENPSNGSRVVACGWTDRQTDRQTDTHDEANSLFRKFGNVMKSAPPEGTVGHKLV